MQCDATQLLMSAACVFHHNVVMLLECVFVKVQVEQLFISQSTFVPPYSQSHALGFSPRVRNLPTIWHSVLLRNKLIQTIIKQINNPAG